jgi:AcrR family transcriptional regulator
MNVKDQLLAAAANVFAEGGYHRATTRRIAAAAGVNEITLFRHFGSKDVLLREALARYHGDETAPLPEEPVDPVAELTEWSRSHLRHLHARAALIRACLAEFGERPGLVTAEVSWPVRTASGLTTYLERLKRRGLAAASFDARAAATMLLGVLFADGVARDIVPDLYPNEPDDALTKYVALFLRGIGVDSRAKRSRA